MELTKRVQGGVACVALAGRLDTITAPQLEDAMKDVLPEAEDLTLDFEQLTYISSAGLRVVLALQKAMNKKGGKMVVSKPNDVVMEVFEVTGFVDILTIEP